MPVPMPIPIPGVSARRRYRGRRCPTGLAARAAASPSPGNRRCAALMGPAGAASAGGTDEPRERMCQGRGAGSGSTGGHRVEVAAARRGRDGNGEGTRGAAGSQLRAAESSAGALGISLGSPRVAERSGGIRPGRTPVPSRGLSVSGPSAELWFELHRAFGAARCPRWRGGDARHGRRCEVPWACEIQGCLFQTGRGCCVVSLVCAGCRKWAKNASCILCVSEF